MTEPQTAPAADSDEHRPRLNPLALPAETDGLFRMMVAGAFLLAMYTVMVYIVFAVLLGASWLFGDVPWNVQVFDDIARTVGDKWIFELSKPEVRTLAERLFTLNLNGLIGSLPRLGFVLVMAGVLGATSIIVYNSHQQRMVRRGKLRTLNEFPRTDLAEKIQSSIEALARQASISPAPEIVVRTRHGGGAQVFGRRRNYFLLLDAFPPTRTTDELVDLRLRCSTPAFRAIVLHELGHIANQDVERSYYSLSVWRVFIALILAPMLAFIVIFNLGNTVRIIQGVPLSSAEWWNAIGRLIVGFASVFAQVAALILVMRAIWYALLRTREYYADWRAVLWGAEAPMKQLMSPMAAHGAAALPSSPDIRSPRGRVRAGVFWAGRQWAGLWRFHTSPSQRSTRIDNPDLLFKISSDVPFLTGVLLSFAMLGTPLLFIYLGLPLFNLSEALSWWLIRLVVDLPHPFSQVLYIAILLIMRLGFQLTFAALSLLLIAYLIVGSLGRQVQRDALADLLPEHKDRWGYVGLWKPALLLAAGLEFGFLIIPLNPLNVVSQLSLLLLPVWFGVFFVLSWFWLIYVRLLSHQILGSHNGDRLPGWKHWLVTLSSLLALWALYLPMLLARISILLITAFPTISERLEGMPMPSDAYLGLTFGFSIVLLLGLGLSLFFLWSTLSVGAAGVVLALRRPRCTRCGERIRVWTVVGRRCSACYKPLAGWLFVQSGLEEHR